MLLLLIRLDGRLSRFRPDGGRSPSPAVAPLHCAVERCNRYGAHRRCAQHRRVIGAWERTPRVECTSAHDCSTPPQAPPLTTRSPLWLPPAAVPPLAVRCTSDHRAGHPCSPRAEERRCGVDSCCSWPPSRCLLATLDDLRTWPFRLLSRMPSRPDNRLHSA